MSPMRATCPAYLILLDLVIFVSGEEYKLPSSVYKWETFKEISE